jgi:hypothetical protein
MERELWSTIKITMEELEDFRRLFHTSTLRRQNLRYIEIKLNDYFEDTIDEVSDKEGDSSSDEDDNPHEHKVTECSLEDSSQDRVIREEDDESNAKSNDDGDFENLDFYLGAERSSDSGNMKFEGQDENDKSDGKNEQSSDVSDENDSEIEDDTSDEETGEETGGETGEETDDEQDERVEESSSERRDNKANWTNNQKRRSAFRDEHWRFFRETTLTWILLSSWGEDLKVTSIEIHIEGGSIYELLGHFFRRPVLVDDCLSPDMWSYDRSLAGMPTLPSVTKLIVTANERIDIWPAIVACQMVHTLPNILDLIIASDDGVKLWKYARKQFRNCKHNVRSS